jgi:hypothetical protein
MDNERAFACGWRLPCFRLRGTGCQTSPKLFSAGGQPGANFACGWWPPWFKLRGTGCQTSGKFCSAGGQPGENFAMWLAATLVQVAREWDWLPNVRKCGCKYCMRPAATLVQVARDWLPDGGEVVVSWQTAGCKFCMRLAAILVHVAREGLTARRQRSCVRL